MAGNEINMVDLARSLCMGPPKQHACDECGRTPATYTFHGTESSNDEYGRFAWNQTYHFCAECFAELKPDFKRRYDADMAENV